MNKILPILFWLAVACVVIVLLTETIIYLDASNEPSADKNYELRLLKNSTPKFTSKGPSTLFSTIKLLYIPIFLILILFVVERIKIRKEHKQHLRMKQKEKNL